MKAQKTLKELKEIAFKKGYFIRGYYDCGIKLYRIWDLNTHKLIKENIVSSKIREMIKEVLK